MVTLTKRERDPGKPNIWSKHDLGAANMLLALQATSLGFSAHFMGGFDAKKVIESFDVDPAVHEPGPCIALGYPGDPEQLEESQREKEIAPRTRKDISEISRQVE
jgi:nitroreductase